FFSEEDEEPKLKKKRPSALYDNPIQASTSVKCVESILKQKSESGPTLHKNDDIIIDGKRNDGTTGLYELIFMKFPNKNVCINDDEQTYEKVFC
ncbi:hypothetical protein ALC56_02875, partial [Trachymyrmex septentrionalis]